MYLRPLLSAECALLNGAKPPTCFLCRAKTSDRELYRCTEPMRPEWTACLRCARTGIRPDPWKERKDR